MATIEEEGSAEVQITRMEDSHQVKVYSKGIGCEELADALLAIVDKLREGDIDGMAVH